MHHSVDSNTGEEVEDEKKILTDFVTIPEGLNQFSPTYGDTGLPVVCAVRCFDENKQLLGSVGGGLTTNNKVLLSNTKYIRLVIVVDIQVEATPEESLVKGRTMIIRQDMKYIFANDEE